jgi:hypothetical protein
VSAFDARCRADALSQPPGDTCQLVFIDIRQFALNVNIDCNCGLKDIFELLVSLNILLGPKRVVYNQFRLDLSVFSC